MLDIYFDDVFTPHDVHTARDLLARISKDMSTLTGANYIMIYDHLSDENCDYTLGIDPDLAIINTKIHGLEKTAIALFRLQAPITLKHDQREKNVDIIGVLLSPAESGNIHLRDLSRLTRTLENLNENPQIREIKDADMLKTILNGGDGLLMAA